jgi:hypothetical protein
MFLGANMDAVSEASSLGIAREYTVDYAWSSAGTDTLYNSMSTVATASKRCDAVLDSINLQNVYDACTYRSSTDVIDDLVSALENTNN